MTRRVLTTHAIDRYRSRFDRTATREQIQALLDEGHHQSLPPKGMYQKAGLSDGTFIIAGQVIFTIKESHGGLVATTCCRRHPRPAAQQRAYRQWQRAEHTEEAA